VISFINICPRIPETGEKMPHGVLIWPYLVLLWPWPTTFWPQNRISSQLTQVNSAKLPQAVY